MQQLLTETALLSLLGGALGLALAQAAITLVRTWPLPGIHRLEETSLDPLALVFTIGLSIGTVCASRALSGASPVPPESARCAEGGWPGRGHATPDSDRQLARRRRSGLVSRAPGRRRVAPSEPVASARRAARVQSPAGARREHQPAAGRLSRAVSTAPVRGRPARSIEERAWRRGGGNLDSRPAHECRRCGHRLRWTSPGWERLPTISR